MRNWSKQFEIVYKKYRSERLSKGVDKRDITEKSMKEFLGVSTGKGDAWKKGQWPSAEDLATIAAKLGFSYRWLVTGEGDPFGDDAILQMHENAASVAPLLDADDRDAKIAALEKDVAYLRELNNAKEEMLSLYKRLLQDKEQNEGRSVAAKDVGISANTHPTVSSLE